MQVEEKYLNPFCDRSDGSGMWHRQGEPASSSQPSLLTTPNDSGSASIHDAPHEIGPSGRYPSQQPAVC